MLNKIDTTLPFSSTTMETITQAELDDIIMFKDHAIRFWKHKADRLEKQYKREKVALALAEETLKKYSRIPQDVLDKLILESKMAEAEALKTQAGSYLTNIGLVKWRQISQEDGGITDVDKKIDFWKNIISIYRHKTDTVSYSDEDTDDSDE